MTEGGRTNGELTGCMPTKVRVSAYRSAVPRKPYRSPRDWLTGDHSNSFGHTSAGSLDWKTPQSGLEEALLVAAKQQSDLSFSIRVNSEWGTGTSQMASFADLHADTVRDVLNGTKHGTLAVLYALANAIGLTLTVTPQGRAKQSTGDQPT
jgi:hypothetical protein